MSTLMIAARFCRERHAMLLVDPPAAWSSARAALEALRSWPFRSENALMHFPRLTALDRLRGRVETFAPCGAVAGMLARLDETWPVWAAAQSEDATLRLGSRPATVVTDSERVRLAQAGVNTLLAVRAPAAAERRGLHARGRRRRLPRLEVFVGAAPRALHQCQHRARHALACVRAEFARRLATGARADRGVS
jgi:phage tail sheath protein FI